jgi:AcrR family transcriptional regulator
MSAKLKPADRKKQILDGAIAQAKAHGYQRITRQGVAEAVAVSTGLINSYFSTMPQLKRAVMRAAVKGEVLEIVAQGLAAKDPQALKAPDSLKKRAVESLTV